MRTRSYRRISALVGAASAAIAGVAGVLLVNPAAANAWPSTTVAIDGHGYGHGRGMSQFGAYGYATIYGWDYKQILSHYYGGTHLSSAAGRQIRVEVSSLAGQSLVVTSTRPMTVGGARIAAGRTVRVTAVGSSFRVATSASCTSAPGVAKAIPATLTSAAGTFSTVSTVGTGDAIASLLTSCSTHRSYRGTLSLVASGGSLHVVNTLPLDSYLRAVVPRESPASWGDAAGGKGINALRAQAVAARTYALNQHRYSYADICDNQNCQVYGGAGLDGGGIEDARSNRAIADTAGQVLVDAAGTLVSAEYSSSSGGYTAGGAFPAVPDLGDVASPNHDWTESVPVAQIESAFGVGRLTGLQVTGRNGLGADGGRVTAIKVTGSTGSRTLTGNEFSESLGLRSNWFSIGRSDNTPTVRLTNRVVPTVPGQIVGFGWNADTPVACDFDGDGRDTVAVFRAGTFYVRNSLAPSAPLTSLRYGLPGDLPVCGDWNGDHRATVGVYRPSTETFYLTNTAAHTPIVTGKTVVMIKLGAPGDVPVAGDWDGTGRDTIGVYRSSTSTFYLLPTNQRSAPRKVYQYGGAGQGALPVVGDFKGDGKDSIGVFRNGVFNLSFTLGGRMAARWTYGQPGDLPLVGNWDGRQGDTAGVGQGYTQY